MKFLDYILGRRKGKEAHRIEQEAMSDPFLSDAIEGYDSVRGDHADRIAAMQSYVQKRTTTAKRPGAWKIAIAAVVFIALLGGYFSLMNHESVMLAAHESGNSYINIYAPDDYIERKGIELAELQEAGADTSGYLQAVVDIVNLHEVIKPIEKINIYMPDLYYAQLDEKEIRELLPAREVPSLPEEHLFAAAPASVALADVIPEENDLSEISVPVSTAPLLAEKKMRESVPESVDPQVGEALAGRMAGVQVQNSQVGAFNDRSVPARSQSLDIRSSNRTIKGKVVDENNEPLTGVTVLAKGTDAGAVTDTEGNYYLNIDSAREVDLIANYIGYETVEIPKAKDNQIIAMTEHQQILNEVVVSGYGVPRKLDYAGSVSGMDVAEAKQVKPKPVIGEKAYKKYLQENLIRPQDTDGCKKGKVIVEFYVDLSGRPVDIQVSKSLCFPFDKEAVRLVEEGPDWTNGSSRVKVEVKF